MHNFNKRRRQFILAGVLSLTSLSVMAQVSQTIIRTVASGNDDAEECVVGGTGTIGAMDLSSSDLEIMLDGSKRQIIGIRFNNIVIPQGAAIQRAYVQFATKGDKNAVAGDVYITAQDENNSGAFTSTAFDITSRAQVVDSVLWAGSTSSTWGNTAGGTAGENQRTPNISSVIQQVVNRPGWGEGNSMVVMFKGLGVRNAYSFDGGAALAPKLIIQYSSPNVPAMPTAVFPIQKNENWKYLDNGSDQGTAWASTGFNDAAWSYGNGMLGYGRNPITTLDFGGNTANKHITYYFRKNFTVADVTTLQDSLVLNLMRDDGAIVYINGIEVVRSNMPTGVVDYLTLAPNLIAAPNETEYNNFRISKSALVTGVNTIAVEIHQQAVNSSDITFDLELKEVPFMAITDFPVAANSEWKYLDNGTDQGTAWIAPTFNDATWAYGPGQLGYANGPQTTVSFGPDANNKFITTYFRKKINIANIASITDTLQLNLLRDDGAIVYVNGVEVVRSNMPVGTIDYLTFAPVIIDGGDEQVYNPYLIPKTFFSTGINTIAVEIHNRDGQSSDLGFDMSLIQYVAPPPPPPVVECDSLPSNHISNFVSVLPSAQPDSLRIPSTHTFQMIVQSGDPYTNPADGVTKGLFDFTGYVPIAGSSTNGYLSINHENGSWPSSGVSMLSLNYNEVSQLWSVTNNVPVDFGVVQGTGRNCSGTVTPWNTIITSEETLPASDVNNDGYQDIGWNVEIDPATHSVIDNNGDNAPDKLWKLGRMSHENVVVDFDLVSVYEGNDESPGYIFKFVADTATKLGSGNLYVLKLNGAIGTATTGMWIQVPNSTPTECNNVRSFASSVSATNFNAVEDVEISPLDSMVYFTSKSSSRVYRFKDNKTVGSANDVVGCIVFVGNSSTLYPITHAGGVANEQWSGGNDNLTFDNEGNLYVIQDGGRNHIWMVKPCHTQANPAVELFAVTPAGSEPTGMTLSPDNKFMFVSIQHPNGSNNTEMIDAAGNPERFNKESAIVIARREFLGTGAPLPISFLNFDAHKTANNKAELEWKYVTDETVAKFEIQRMIAGNTFETLEMVEKLAPNKEAATYTFVDEHPYSGKNFYRIKAIQADGKHVFTNIKVVDIALNNELSIVKSYPNPTAHTFHITLVSPAAKAANVKVYNTTGTVSLEKEVKLTAGSNEIALNVESLPAGVYSVIIISDNDIIKTRVVKN